MAWVKEFSTTSNGSSNTVIVTVPTGGVALGHFLVLAVMNSTNVATPTWTVTDTRSNTWTSNATYNQKVITGSNGAIWIFTCVLTTALQAGDSITLNSSTGTTIRAAVAVEEFDDTITGIDTGSTGDNGGTTSASPSSGNFTTTQASELLIGGLGQVSPARVFTAAAGWTQGTKIATTNGSGDRAVTLIWQYVSSTGSYAASGTFDNGSVYGMAGAGYTISGGGGGGGARTGNAKVWNGSAWVSHPVKVWNGSAWVVHPAKGYDGSSWIVGK